MKRGNILLVVLVTVAVLGIGVGGVWWWGQGQYNWSLPFGDHKQIADAKPKEGADSWKIYRDSEDVFELRYPSELMVSPASQSGSIGFYLQESKNSDNFVPSLWFDKYPVNEKVSLAEFLAEKSYSEPGALSRDFEKDKKLGKLYKNPSNIKQCGFGGNEFLCFQSDSGPSSFEEHRIIKSGAVLVDAYEWLPGSGVGGPNEKLLKFFDQILSTFKFL